ncbi:three prime repair exonuclease 2-like [Vanessa cardui]|uniref:three prime repair exonuclease 2-like n=1 Tax=Vanessa cardui TaxID=171605 RepID=UPI001F131CC8|nr:three prime repair exonuclease 2-like [Vanessa cardui]
MSIKTFMFFDLETTGLPARDHVPKVTELTFLCVCRKDIEKADIDNLPPVSKLTFLFNPQKEVSSEAASITGLNNEILINQPIFSEKIKCIVAFLDFPKPVCLVAHNGNRFDFKIIKNEFATAKAVLPRGLYCVDSLKAFKEILKDNVLNELEISNSFNQTFLNSDSSLDEDAWPDLNVTQEEWTEIDNIIDSFAKLKTTPNIRRDGNKMAIESYKLTDIYKTLMKKDPKESHRAEADCMMLLECVIKTKKYFLPWADKNYKLLSAIKPF